MRPKGTKQELEVRRRTAIALLNQGLGVSEVARQLGVGSGSVSRWKKVFEEGGEAALKAKRHPGSKPRLSDEELAELKGVIVSGARAVGYDTELWTLARVAEVIQDRFGVSYTHSGVWHVLRRLGFTAQKPERQARERDDEAVATWRQKEWRRIKRGRVGRAARSS